jgi:toxin ParE1/3/4
MSEYQLSKTAVKDLESILEFGIQRFGLTVALEYYDGLEKKLEEIAKYPKQFPSRYQIREGYRIGIYQSHDIYFSENESTILIVRVLSRQNIETAIQTALEQE